MAKRKTKEEVLSTVPKDNQDAYFGWAGDLNKNPEALKQFSDTVNEFRGILPYSARAGRHQDYSDLDTNISGRPSFSQEDYYAFRPDERPPQKYDAIIKKSDAVYQTVGLIRNMIDLMADFACQGIRLVHPNKRIEKFYQNWFLRVKGTERSERFLNTFYRLGNVVIRKQTAKINVKKKKALFKAGGKPDIVINKTFNVPGEIPWKYIFLNPTMVRPIGGPLSSFVGEPMYGIKLPRQLANIIKKAKTPQEKKIVSSLPEEIKKAAQTNNLVLLPPEKTHVCHYKKDDWQSWAFPMIYAILDDITTLQKLRLADMAALDGAISNIRLWKLGSLEHKIAPTRNAAIKLGEILESNVGGGTMDMIWTPDIELVETKTNVHEFLGEEKYRPHLNAIYAGLGIPQTLTGGSGAGGTTNNLISLETLISRLEYGRGALENFWLKEIVEVQKAMGFRFPAKVEFSFINLGDKAAEKNLLVQLADRSLISDELLQHLFGNDPEIERIRLNREDRERHGGKLIPKSSPYHDPQFGLALKKVALQSGAIMPSQVGLTEDAVIRDLKTFELSKEDKKTLNDMKAVINDKKSGQPQQGRPKNSKDKTARKKKQFTPKVKAGLDVWLRNAQDTIAKVLNPLILKQFNKKNMRSLTFTETGEAERLKFSTLYHLEPLSVISRKSVVKAFNCGDIPTNVYNLYCDWSMEVGKTINRKLTLDELKQVQLNIYTYTKIGDENGYY